MQLFSIVTNHVALLRMDGPTLGAACLVLAEVIVEVALALTHVLARLASAAECPLLLCQDNHPLILTNSSPAKDTAEPTRARRGAHIARVKKSKNQKSSNCTFSQLAARVRAEEDPFSWDLLSRFTPRTTGHRTNEWNIFVMDPRYLQRVSMFRGFHARICTGRHDMAACRASRGFWA